MQSIIERLKKHGINTDTFCFAPYVNVDLDQSGEVYSCYRGKDPLSNWKELPLDVEFNNENYRNLRQGLFNGQKSSNCNALIFKLDLELVRPRAGIRMTPSDTNICVGSPIRFENTGTTGSSVWWTIGTIGQPPVHSAQTSFTQYTFTTPGTYRVRLVVEGCQQFDTTFKTVVVTPPPVITKYAPPTSCPGDTVWLRVDSLDASGGLLSITWVADPFLLPGAPGLFRRRAVVTGTRWFYFDVISASGCVLRDSLRARTMALRRHTSARMRTSHSDPNAAM